MSEITKLDKYMAVKEADENGLVWYDPTEKPFRLCGFYWYERDRIFRRLPKESPWKITEAVDVLSNCTAGGQIRFRTDSKRIVVRLLNLTPGRMDHMPDTGRSGVDLYIGEPTRERFWSTLRRTEYENVFTYELMNLETVAMRDFVLNFPLYNGVKSIELGLDEAAVVEAPKPFVREQPVVIYGTSITQGGCANRPGMAFTNILSRKLNIEFLNYGFSGNGKCESELAEILSEIADPALFIIDCEANCAGDPPAFAKRLTAFIDILRRDHPTMPILVLTRIAFARENAENADLCRRLQMDEVNRRYQAGDKNIHFMDGGKLLGNDFDECTVDGVHPTDLGFSRMAESLQDTIRRLIK